MHQQNASHDCEFFIKEVLVCFEDLKFLIKASLLFFELQKNLYFSCQAINIDTENHLAS